VMSQRTTPDALSGFLQGAGESRLLRKMDGFQQRLARFNQDFEEVLYQGIMGALGYRHNQAAFLQLAEQMPVCRIKELTGSLPRDQQPDAIQQILFNSAGLMPKGQSNNQIYWRIPGGRPANSPYRRIAGMSYLLTKTPSLLNESVRIITESPSTLKMRQELIKLLVVPDSKTKWGLRLKPQSSCALSQAGLIGKERAEEIILNIIIPITYLYSQLKKDTKLQESILNLYRAYPKLMENYYTRFMKQRVFNSDEKLFKPIVRTASIQQGLIEIFTDYCKKGYEGCERCGLLEWLKS
jgi:hypothetical protein